MLEGRVEKKKRWEAKTAAAAVSVSLSVSVVERSEDLMEQEVVRGGVEEGVVFVVEGVHLPEGGRGGGRCCSTGGGLIVKGGGLSFGFVALSSLPLDIL